MLTGRLYGAMVLYLLMSSTEPSACSCSDIPANTSTVAGDVNGPVVVICVNAHKFTKPPCAPETTEVMDKASGVSRQANDCAVYIDDKCVGAVDFSARRKTYVYETN